ncbi:trypsin-like peptidase domain-containing protein, partial [Thomasclavelia cocleata]
MEERNLIEENKPMEEKEIIDEKPLEDKLQSDFGTTTRIERNRDRFAKQNNFKLFHVILVILVVVSLGANVFMFSRLNDSNSPISLNSNAKVQQVNYDVKSSTTDVIKKVSDSVVGVLVYSNGAASGSGSGVVYHVDGRTAYVITNAHVVDGAQDVQVVFSNKESVKATLLGSD